MDLVEPAKRLRPEDLDGAIRELGDRPATCLLCDSDRLVELFQRSGKTFWQCGGCELVFVHDIYPEFVSRPPGDDAVEELHDHGPRTQKKIAGWLAHLSKFRRLNRLLDVGCGQGEFLQRASESGWDVTGVDVNPARVRLAREARGLDVREGQLRDVGFDPGSFDVVFMSEVIEHIVDPIDLMREVRRVLRRGGVVFVSTGNASSWSARLRGAKWDYYRFGYMNHIRYYSPAAARALARAAGFGSVDVYTRGFALRESGELGKHWSKPVVKLSQGVISVFAGPMGAGHRLELTFHRD